MVLEKISKTDKSLVKLTTRDKIQINQIRIKNKKGNIITDISKMNKIMTDFRQNYFMELENLEEMHRFLDVYNTPELNNIT